MTQHMTLQKCWSTMEIKKRLEFKNRNIARYQSDFKHGLQRVYTPFNFDKNTQYKELCLCEYRNGEKHFVIRFYLNFPLVFVAHLKSVYTVNHIVSSNPILSAINLTFRRLFQEISFLGSFFSSYLLKLFHQVKLKFLVHGIHHL